MRLSRNLRRVLPGVIVFLLMLICPAFAEDAYRMEYAEEADVFVYEPKAAEPGKDYPVLYLFHGKWQQPSIWEDIGLLDALNELSADGEIEPFYVIVPHDKNYMVDLYEDAFYDEFLNVVMPYVEENYPVSTEREKTALGGVSRGALWAQYFAFAVYGRFGHIGVHSPPNAFFSLPKLYGILRDNPEVEKVNIRIDIGNADNGMRIGQEFSKELTDLFYPHEFVLGVGGHDVDYWHANIKTYLRWYNERFSE